MLLGEAPSRAGDRFHMFPLSGRPARVLCELAGIPPISDGTTYGRWTWALYDRFDCTNVFERYAEATPWSAPRAAQALRDRVEVFYCRTVVCLGRRPQKALYDAFRAGSPPDFHEVGSIAGGRGVLLGLDVVAIPHPSGLNRALNDPAERDRCGETLRAALEGAVRAS